LAHGSQQGRDHLEWWLHGSRSSRMDSWACSDHERPDLRADVFDATRGKNRTLMHRFRHDWF
jgi:hypothetical protein